MPNNNKKNKVKKLPIIIVAAIIIIALAWPQLDYKKQIEELRYTTQAGIDSTVEVIINEQNTRAHLLNLIANGKIKEADSLLTPLLSANPKNSSFHILKGIIYEARKNYDSSIYEYTTAIKQGPSPDALNRRAITYIKMRKIEDAISDYKEAFYINSDYSYKLAAAFELSNQKDSAVKYYKIYIESYPDSIYQKLSQENIHLEYPPDSAKMKIIKLSKIN